MAFSNAVNSANVLDDPLIGVDLGEFNIIELIGNGSWANVYKAIDLTLRTVVAVKVVHNHVLKDEESIKRFRQEAKLLSCFKSNSVIRVIGADTSPVSYLVMEYFDGIPLNKWLKMNGPMNSHMVIDLFMQLCRALSEAEAFNIVHRDLKPANILIRTHGNAVEAKILDFGLAKCLDSKASKITSTGDIIGSPSYMSPEQFKGHCDIRSDLYSLGCIMYEMLTGSPVFSGKNSFDYMHKHLSTNPQRISELNPNVKNFAGLDEVVHRCLEKSPKKRYQSANLLRRDLKTIKDRCKPNFVLADRHSKNKIARIVAFATFASTAMMSR